jgi:hypothetical protein
MGEYLRFHKMVTPVIIQVVFWIFAILAVIAGILQLTQNVLTGVLIIVLGPLAVRVYAEILIVLFEINEALQDIRGGTRMRPSLPASAPSGMPPA